MLKLVAGVILALASLLIAADSLPPLFGESARVVFDLPYTVECREVTPPRFAATHPSLKVIEAKFQVSARMVAGSETDIVDFLYIITSPDQTMRFQAYLPNTSLESSVVDDQIEITDTTENSKEGEIGAHVGYQGVGGGLSRTRGSKKTHSSHYKRIAARDLVVASGTTDHEHGVFFKLKPSRATSMEGAKEFTFLATVPRTWRAGWCTISCAARAESKTVLYRTRILPAGVAQSQMGLYLEGDAEASRVADELGAAQRQHADVLAGQLSKDGFFDEMYEAASTGKTASLCGVFKMSAGERSDDAEQVPLDKAHRAVLGAQERLERLSE